MPGRFLASLILPLLFVLPSFGQSWQHYYERTKETWGVDWDQTESLLFRAKELAAIDLGIYHEDYLTICEELGIAYMQSGKLSKAEGTFHEVLQNRHDMGFTDVGHYENDVTLLAKVYFEQGAILQADSLFQLTLETNPNNFNAMQGRAQVFQLNVQLDSAHAYYNHANNLINKGQHLSPENVLLFKLLFADFERQVKNYNLSGKAYAELDQLFIQNGSYQDLAIYGKYLNDYGLFLQETGQYDQSEKHLIKALRFWENIEESYSSFYAETLNNLAILYISLGFLDTAEGYLENAFMLCAETNRTQSLSCMNLLNNLASIAVKKGEIERAIALYHQLLESANDLPKNDRLSLLNNLALAYTKNDQSAKAKAVYQDLLASDEISHASRSIVSSLLNNLGVIELTQLNYSEAEDLFAQSIKHKEEIWGDKHPQITDILYNQASLYLISDQLGKADPVYTRAFESQLFTIKYLFPNLTSKQKAAYYEKASENFEQYCSFAVRRHKENPEILIDLMARQMKTKALLFDSDKLILNEIRKTRDRELALTYDSLKQIRFLITEGLETHQAKNNQELTLKAEHLEKELTLAVGDRLIEERAENIDWKKLKAKLSHEEALIELVRFRKFDVSAETRMTDSEIKVGFSDSVYYAALIVTDSTTEHPDLVLLKNGRELESRYANFYRNAMKYGIKDTLTYDWFWSEIDKKIRGKSKIYLVNDGIYHRINPETFLNKGQYLLETKSIQYLNNSMELMATDAHFDSQNRSALLIGNPDFSGLNDDELNLPALPGSQREVLNIGSLLESNGWSTNVLLSSSATEKNLKQSASHNIIHLATHGFFRSSQNALHPLMESGLYMSPSKELSSQLDYGNDGKLTAYEIMNYDFSETGLVVLSACETGLGEIHHGEGVFGLQRAIRLAGAKSLMFSLWKIDDEHTSILMGDFYEKLLKGQSPKNALSSAQKNMIRNGLHPYYWGAFVLGGDN